MSVRLILILALVHDLPAQSIDFVLAFPQANLDIPVFMELPVGVEAEGGSRGEYIIELRKSLYGLKQASLAQSPQSQTTTDKQIYIYIYI